jgi:hypothetical protein
MTANAEDSSRAAVGCRFGRGCGRSNPARLADAPKRGSVGLLLNTTFRARRYRIATNACLDHVARRGARPAALCAPSATPAPIDGAVRVGGGDFLFDHGYAFRREEMSGIVREEFDIGQLLREAPQWLRDYREDVGAPGLESAVSVSAGWSGFAMRDRAAYNTYRVYPHSRLITPLFSGLLELLPNKEWAAHSISPVSSHQPTSTRTTALLLATALSARSRWRS